MADIRISIRGGKTRFRPNETIEGSANWNLSSQPQAVEIRLMWQTRGKGTQDASVVESTTVATPATMGDSPFRFTLPDAPHSFAGQLIALVWYIEVVVIQGRSQRDSEMLEFEMSPFDVPINLPKVETPLSPLQSKFAQRVSNYASSRSVERK